LREEELTGLAVEVVETPWHEPGAIRRWLSIARGIGWLTTGCLKMRSGQSDRSCRSSSRTAWRGWALKQPQRCRPPENSVASTINARLAAQRIRAPGRAGRSLRTRPALPPPPAH
jgi:hypothetical protein